MVNTVCAKIGCSQKAAQGQKYCSAGHAPYSGLSNASPSKSTTASRSTTQEPGEKSVMSSAEKQKTSYVPAQGKLEPDHGTKDLNRQGNAQTQDAQNEQKKIEQSKTKEGEATMQEIVKTSSEKSLSAGTKKIPYGSLTVLPPDSSTESFQGKSLLDSLTRSSINTSKELLKKLRASDRMMDPRMIQATFQGVKTSAELMRLYIECEKLKRSKK